MSLFRRSVTAAQMRSMPVVHRDGLVHHTLRLLVVDELVLQIELTLKDSIHPLCEGIFIGVIPTGHADLDVMIV